jgi:hypothetical protein
MSKKPTIPQPRHRDDLGRNALVNLLENIDGAQTMKDAGKPQEEVIGYVETAIAEFKATPGVSCDGGAIFFLLWDHPRTHHPRRDVQ